jgi:hypothetical protein
MQNETPQAPENELGLIDSDISASDVYRNAKAMDGKDSKFLSTEIIQAGRMFNTAIEHPGLWGYENVVTFGNTGLMLVLDKGIYYRHFLPDGSSYAKPGMEKKHAHAYIAGIVALTNWYSSEHQGENLKCYGVTNERFSNFMSRLLGENIYTVMKQHKDDFGEEVVSQLNVELLSKDTQRIIDLQNKYREIFKRKYRMESLLS